MKLLVESTSIDVNQKLSLPGTTHRQVARQASLLLATSNPELLFRVWTIVLPMAFPYEGPQGRFQSLAPRAQVSLLFYATQCGQLEVVRYLVEVAKVDVDGSGAFASSMVFLALHGRGCRLSALSGAIRPGQWARMCGTAPSTARASTATCRPCAT